MHALIMMSSNSATETLPRAQFRSDEEEMMNEALEARKQSAAKVHQAAKIARMWVMQNSLAASVQANARVEEERRRSALAESAPPPRRQQVAFDCTELSSSTRRQIAFDKAPL